MTMLRLKTMAKPIIAAMATKMARRGMRSLPSSLLLVKSLSNWDNAKTPKKRAINPNTLNSSAERKPTFKFLSVSLSLFFLSFVRFCKTRLHWMGCKANSGFTTKVVGLG